MSKVKVYYNSACPVCNAGIKYEQRKLEETGGQIDWIDVHQRNDAVDEIGAELEFVRERLHVVDESGRLRVGADAFAALWRLHPRQVRLARWAAWPVIGPLFRCGYNLFAAGLYRWNLWCGHWQHRKQSR